ncbi:RICIN domain-containing protein, partial [Streptomyces griseus]|uniref:RICIN domain-containing protein n=1 Tax=Streptomyces griseus TaxID=1911 RepID=UPI0033C9D261
LRPGDPPELDARVAGLVAVALGERAAAGTALVNEHSGKRLDVAGAATENGTRIQQWKANNFGAQEWLIEQHPEAPGTVTLVSFVSGLVMEVADRSTAAGGTVQQWEDTDSPFQWWRLEPVPQDG